MVGLRSYYFQEIGSVAMGIAILTSLATSIVMVDLFAELYRMVGSIVQTSSIPMYWYT